MATGGAVQWPTCTDASTALMQSKRSGNRHGDGTDHLIAQLISGGGRASEEVEIGPKFRQARPESRCQVPAADGGGYPSLRR
jgi:hypothetical protein